MSPLQPRTLVIDTWEAFDDDMTFNLGGDETCPLVVLLSVGAVVVGGGGGFGAFCRATDLSDGL